MTYQPTFDEMRTDALRRLWRVYTDPQNQDLVNSLASFQKLHPDWQEKANDIMQAMGVHDAGLFPDDLIATTDEQDSFEAYCNERMTRNP